MYGSAALKEAPKEVHFPPPPRPIQYPETDGEPMAETDIHRIQMTDAIIHPLKEHFRNEPDVYVSGNLLLYYEEGNPTSFVSPDAFVVKGVSNHLRRTYKLWLEGEVPNVVIELSSKSTRRKDLGEKRLLYEELDIPEYFVFDPLQEYLKIPLRGFRLAGDFYTPLLPVQVEKNVWELYSEELDLVFQCTPEGLRIYDPVNERYLLTPAEEAEARRVAQARAHQEAEARQVAQARAHQEAEARRVAQARATQAEARLSQAEEEIARLRALLTQQTQAAENSE